MCRESCAVAHGPCRRRTICVELFLTNDLVVSVCRVPVKAECLEAFTKWHVAFHGTRADCVKKILKAGLLIPGKNLWHLLKWQQLMFPYPTPNAWHDISWGLKLLLPLILSHLITSLDLSGDYTPEGVRLKPPANHFDEDNPEMAPPEGHDINKIYLSPSIRYAGVQVYAPKWT